MPQHRRVGRTRRASTGPEDVVNSQIEQLVGTRRDLCVIWRNNTGAMQGPDGRLIQFGKVGSPDWLGILRTGRWLGIEAKSAAGRQSPDQCNFERVVTEMGGLYVLARSGTEALNAILRALGLLLVESPAAAPSLPLSARAR